MFKNYLKIALRNLWRHKGFSFLNVMGLAIGMTAGFLILMYVVFELSYDKFHSNGDNIYRVVADIQTPSEKFESDKPTWAVPKNLESQFEEIESAVRIMDLGGMLVRNGNLNFEEDFSVAADSSFFQIFDFELVQGDKKNVLVEPYT
ncbi:MAG: ABC transporter permease, partial [Pricia sp.]